MVSSITDVATTVDPLTLFSTSSASSTLVESEKRSGCFYDAAPVSHSLIHNRGIPGSQALKPSALASSASLYFVPESLPHVVNRSITIGNQVSSVNEASDLDEEVDLRYLASEGTDSVIVGTSTTQTPNISGSGLAINATPFSFSQQLSVRASPYVKAYNKGSIQASQVITQPGNFCDSISILDDQLIDGNVLERGLSFLLPAHGVASMSSSLNHRTSVLQAVFGSTLFGLVIVSAENNFPGLDGDAIRQCLKLLK